MVKGISCIEKKTTSPPHKKTQRSHGELIEGHYYKES
jgi:hypothetical protein